MSTPAYLTPKEREQLLAINAELLAALERFIAVGDYTSETAEQARAAIAKAKGQP